MSGNNINTYGGGPAFPWQIEVAAGSVNPIRGGTVAMPTIEVMPGLTCRDYAAMHATVTTDEIKAAISLVPGSAGREIPPETVEDVAELLAILAEAEARLRYLKADAMLKARVA